MAINPGTLDRYITIEYPATQTQDGNFDPYKTDWTTAGQMWGKLVTRAGRNAFQSGREENIGDIQVMVRWGDLRSIETRSLPNAISNMRLSFNDGSDVYSYTIVDAVEAPEYGRFNMAIISAKKTNSQ